MKQIEGLKRENNRYNTSVVKQRSYRNEKSPFSIKMEKEREKIKLL